MSSTLGSVVFFVTLQGTNISHLGKRKIIFKYALSGGYVNFLEGNAFWISKKIGALDMYQNLANNEIKLSTSNWWRRNPEPTKVSQGLLVMVYLPFIFVISHGYPHHSWRFYGVSYARIFACQGTLGFIHDGSAFPKHPRGRKRNMLSVLGLFACILNIWYCFLFAFFDPCGVSLHVCLSMEIDQFPFFVVAYSG